MLRHFRRPWLLALLLGMAGTAPAMAASVPLPALVEPASREHHVGKVVFVELVTPDLAAAKQFYGGLFGWTFRDVQGEGWKYAEASLNGHPVAGLVQKELPAGEHRPPAWLSFISVRDVDAAKALASQRGAKVLFEPHNIANRGREAVFADPQGAIFAVIASSSGDPSDVLAAPGEWIWSSLITTNPDADAGFYQKLFNYEVFNLPPDVFNAKTDTDAHHLLLASDKYARASVNPLPGNSPEIRPHWLNFIHVEDAVKMTEKLVALGGRVLVKPQVDRHGGKVAVVADPAGARFGLLEWVDTDRKEVTK